MRKSAKAVSVLMTALIILLSFSSAFVSFAGETTGSVTVTNPYADIDWETVNQYKTALHTHTNQSDGDPTMFESLERHAECGFDLVATTDHGSVNYTWEDNSENSLIYGALSLVGKSEGDLVPVGKSGKFRFKSATVATDTDAAEFNEVSYTLSKSENGDDYISLADGRKIMRVPYGIENNAVSANAHVNSWFADYHNNFITTYETAVKGVSDAGGVCVINHPGEYSKARYELHSSDAYNTDTFCYWYLVNKWAGLIDKYDCCIGIDMNSKGDGRTRFDRILWDVLLERFSANGENVYAICSSDAHQLSKIDTGYTYILMQEQTSAAMKKAMFKGEMIAGSHCNGNPDELKDIAAAVKEFYGETDFFKGVTEAYEKMDANVAAIENGDDDPDEDVGYEYDFCLDNEGRFVGESQPVITSVAVDNASGAITINSENALIVRWISDGKQFAATKADAASVKLADYKDKIGNYVRAEVIGEGGILYTQAFLLNADRNKGTTDVVDSGYINFGFIDCLFAIFKNWGDIIGRTFSNLF